MRVAAGFSLLMVLVLLPLGCGKSYKLAPVSGRVTLDGHPLAHAEVRFFPTSGTDLPTSVDVTDDEGYYELHVQGGGDTPGAVVGEHRVTISMDQGRGKIMPKARPNMPAKKLGELLPSRYNRDSKLTCTVPLEGRNDANFDLKSK